AQSSGQLSMKSAIAEGLSDDTGLFVMTVIETPRRAANESAASCRGVRMNVGVSRRISECAPSIASRSASLALRSARSARLALSTTRTSAATAGVHGDAGDDESSVESLPY